MGTNKEQKHTPEPWYQSHRQIEGEEDYATEIYANDGNTIGRVAWFPRPKTPEGVIGTYRDVNAKRIVVCVNAMEGIDDPEKWVKVAKESLVTAKTTIDLQSHIIKGLKKYRTACEQINPQNPILVANELGNLISFTKILVDDLEGVSIGTLAESSRQLVKKLLTKIKSK